MCKYIDNSETIIILYSGWLVIISPCKSTQLCLSVNKNEIVSPQQHWNMHSTLATDNCAHTKILEDGISLKQKPLQCHNIYLQKFDRDTEFYIGRLDQDLR